MIEPDSHAQMSIHGNLGMRAKEERWGSFAKAISSDFGIRMGRPFAQDYLQKEFAGTGGKQNVSPNSRSRSIPLVTHVLAILLHIRNILLGRESAQVQDDLVGDLARRFVDCLGFRHFFVIVSASLNMNVTGRRGGSSRQERSTKAQGEGRRNSAYQLHIYLCVISHT